MSCVTVCKEAQGWQSFETITTLEESCDVMSELGLIEVKDEILGKT